MAGKFRAEAVNGPTTQNGLPPFAWDGFGNISHEGLPKYYNFTFVQMQPILFRPWATCAVASSAWCKLLSFFCGGGAIVRFWNSDSFAFVTSQGRWDDFISAHGHSVTLRATFWCTSANISGLYFCMSLWLYWDKMCNDTSLACGFIKGYSINRSPVFNLVLRCIDSHPGCLLAGWAQT